MKLIICSVSLLIGCGLLATAHAQQATSDDYQIETSVIAGGGGAASADYSVTAATIGGIYGLATSVDYTTGGGYTPQIFTLGSTGIDLKDYDSWIGQFFTPGTPRAARDFDADGDGISNEDEFLALTNPDDPNSRLDFVILGVSENPAQVDLRFAPYEPDTTLRTYRLLGQGDLSGSFTPLGLSPQTAPGGAGTFQDTQPLAPEHFFYRLEITIPN